MTQTDRVLRMLKRTGGRGICQAELLGPVIDGGPPITRLAARINDLEAAGHVIATAGRRRSCTVYLLVREAGAIVAPQADLDGQAALFDVPPPEPRNALDDDWKAA